MADVVSNEVVAVRFEGGPNPGTFAFPTGVWPLPDSYPGGPDRGRYVKVGGIQIEAEFLGRSSLRRGSGYEWMPQLDRRQLPGTWPPGFSADRRRGGDRRLSRAAFA
jgi:hypothetical protein